MQKNKFWLPKEALSQHGVTDFSGLTEKTIMGQDFVIVGEHSPELLWNQSSQDIKLNLPLWRFRKNRMNVQGQLPQSNIAPESANGAFFNYNLSSTRLNQSLGHYTNASGELGVFTHQYGFFRQSGTYSPKYFNSADESESAPEWLRLDTTWRKDDWYHLNTLEVGDSTTSAAHWGGSVNFGGISFYKNYNLKPRLNIHALPQINQSTELPQNVQLQVNGVPVGNYQVNPGAYQFYNIPVSNGSGTITVKSTDKNGKVTTYKVPYFSDPNLLKAGLSSYAVQLGWIRQNYGIDSFNYGQPAVALNYNHGVSPLWSYQLHSSLLDSQQTFGSTQFLRTGPYGIVSLDTAVSMEHSQPGSLGGLGYLFQYGKLSLDTDYQVSSPHFTQISTADSEPESSNGYQTSMGASYDLGSWGGISVGALYQNPTDSSQPSSHIYSATLSTTLARGLTLTSSYQTYYTDTHQWSFGLNLSYQFDQNQSVSSSYQHTQDSQSQVLSYLTNRQLSNGRNIATSLSGTTQSANSESDRQLNGSVYLGGTSTGDYSASFYQSGSENQITANADGGVLWMDNHVLLTPTLYDGFALVDTSNIKSVGVNQDGLSLGQSDEHGLFVIPDLTAYTVSNINISPDLPLNLKEMNNDIKVMPYYRSGVLVKFDIRHIHQILVRLVNEQGKPLSIGTNVDVLIDGKQQTLVVGSNGLAYFSSQGHHFSGHVITGKLKSGTFNIDFKPTKKTIVRTTAVVHTPKLLATSTHRLKSTEKPAKHITKKAAAPKKPHHKIVASKPVIIEQKKVVLVKPSAASTLPPKKAVPIHPLNLPKTSTIKKPKEKKAGKNGPEIYISGEFVTVLYYEYKEFFMGKAANHKNLMTFSPFSLSVGKNATSSKVSQEVTIDADHMENKLVRQGKKLKGWLSSTYSQYFS
ncbi:fimbria/pilus outer membrane usher protein [Vibrio marisflavi]|nr:fimbria/pilus outer membrane usher protein [Vibrio marisflavi]